MRSEGKTIEVTLRFLSWVDILVLVPFTEVTKEQEWDFHRENVGNVFRHLMFEVFILHLSEYFHYMVVFVYLELSRETWEIHTRQ